MSLPYNASQVIGQILTAGTLNVTGSMTGTFYVIIIFLFAISILFGIPLEITAILLLPFVITLAAYSTSFLMILIFVLLYFAAILARNFLGFR